MQNNKVESGNAAKIGLAVFAVIYGIGSIPKEKVYPKKEGPSHYDLYRDGIKDIVVYNIKSLEELQ